MAHLETIRRPVPVEFALQRWLEFVSSAGRAGVERICRNVRHYRGEDGVWFTWRYSQEMVPDEGEASEASGSTAAATRKRNAAPTWADINAAFGDQGAVYNADGKQVGYKYPEPRSDEERRRMNQMVYDMWNPQRRIALEIGGERSAKTAVTTLVDQRTGREHQVVAAHAEFKAKKAGLVEKRARMKPKKGAQ